MNNAKSRRSTPQTPTKPDATRHGLSPEPELPYVGPITNPVTGHTTNIYICRKSDDSRELFRTVAEQTLGELHVYDLDDGKAEAPQGNNAFTDLLHRIFAEVRNERGAK